MSTIVVLQQMLIIFILILVGVALYKKGMVTEDSSRNMSALIINVTNPALLICSAFDDSVSQFSLGKLAMAFLVFGIAYLVLLAMAYVIPLILGVRKRDRYVYRMITIFGNMSFIGIPVVSAVLGAEALIYAAVCNLYYAFFFYTYGVAVMHRAARSQGKEQEKTGFWSSLKSIFNMGTISAIVTIVLFLTHPQVPDMVSTTLNYMGRTTTFLSMVVLGVAVAQMPLRRLFTSFRLYFFAVIRMLVIPIAFVLVTKQFVEDSLLVNATALLLAMPVASMPLMIAKQLDVDGDEIARGIILTTILSVILVPLVALFTA